MTTQTSQFTLETRPILIHENSTSQYCDVSTTTELNAPQPLHFFVNTISPTEYHQTDSTETTCNVQNLKDNSNISETNVPKPVSSELGDEVQKEADCPEPFSQPSTSKDDATLVEIYDTSLNKSQNISVDMTTQPSQFTFEAEPILIHENSTPQYCGVATTTEGYNIQPVPVFYIVQTTLQTSDSQAPQQYYQSDTAQQLCIDNIDENNITSDPTSNSPESDCVLRYDDDDEEVQKEADCPVPFSQPSTSKDVEEVQKEANCPVLFSQPSTSKVDHVQQNNSGTASDIMHSETVSEPLTSSESSLPAVPGPSSSKPRISKGPSKPKTAVPSTSRSSKAARVKPTMQSNLCSSVNINNVSDAINATEETKNKLCKTCAKCTVIAKIHDRHEVSRARQQQNSTDVYEFDAQTDDSSRVTPFHSQSKRRKARAQGSSVDTNSEEEQNKAPAQEHSLEENEDDFNQLLQQLSTAPKTKPAQKKKKKPTPRRAASPKPSTSRGSASERLAARRSKFQSPLIQITQEEKKKSMKQPTTSQMVEAPTFHLTEEEFNDPIVFFTKILPAAEKYGICKIVAPKTFKPKCHLSEDMNFKVTNQHPARMYNRWGPASREYAVMKAYLASQKVLYSRGPLVDGIEINLHKFYHVVQSFGGLEQVEQKRRWSRVAEAMCLPEKCKTKLENIYVKYLLPFDTASKLEREQLMGLVEKRWNAKYNKMRKWAMNPLHAQKKLLGESDSSEDEEEENDLLSKVLKEAEDCVTPGRKMDFASFKKVAKHGMNMHFPNGATTEEVEKAYWDHVLLGREHVVVHAASIDTGPEAYGFSKSKDPCSKHPWNLKMLSNNPGNVLPALGDVLGVTVPTLHFGMVFATSCWHRDPHGLPWMEYMHEGSSKIWYGIPADQSEFFRKAVEELCPILCQNKSVWLPSDITMIPPKLLLEHNVSLSHVVQNPGEYIVVFPQAYSCSICTTLVVSESVYFATYEWLKSVNQVFQELRESCEPTAFSLEQLLIALSKNQPLPMSVLQLVHASLSTILQMEMSNRPALYRKGLTPVILPLESESQLRRPKRGKKHAWNVRDLDDCQICRTPLYIAKVTGITGKKMALCTTHALGLLEIPKYKNVDMAHVQFIQFFSDTQLEEILSSFQRRLQQV
ncbi:protein Jumonji isoform X3 [Hyposmocoma kahamanoa]|uniref:protein Jumonji isoform X3 n=1 Tax=Hyposmocoma kahamanoa TaxID=1477025 RepID=UPI000E6D8F56|nr:protein Jumonji isoform X3 [Hyposmocoma kahamanoa]